jgi:DNA-binding transcriptional MerR regulator
MNAEPARSYLGIGEVLAQLRPEFPDLQISKIRFLESEGLIEPARSPAGYRRFAAADVQRLRFILTAQRDQYLPLRVIKEQLARATAGDTAASRPGGARPGGVPQPPGRAAARRVLLSRAELLEATGIEDVQLTELEEFGLIRRTGRQFGRDALEVAGTVAALASYGVQARHLGAARAAAERETSLIERVVAPMLRQRTPGAADRAGAVAREIAALTLRLHRALVENSLVEAGLPASAEPQTDPFASSAPAGAPLPAPGPERGIDPRGVRGASA